MVSPVLFMRDQVTGSNPTVFLDPIANGHGGGDPFGPLSLFSPFKGRKGPKGLKGRCDYFPGAFGWAFSFVKSDSSTCKRVASVT